MIYILKGLGGFLGKADDGLDQAFLCLWRSHINSTLSTSGVTDSCFSKLNQTQLISDIKMGLNVAFSNPSLNSTAGQSINTMGQSFKCLKGKLAGFTGQSTRATVVSYTNTCFPSQDSTTQLIVAAVISSFDLLALQNSN